MKTLKTPMIEDLEYHEGLDRPNDPDPGEEQAPADEIEIRRRRGVSAWIAAAAGLVALAYLVRMVAGEASGLDVVVGFVVATIAGTYLWTLIDSRAPLLILDAHGVRLRRGATWHGVAWTQIATVECHPRTGGLGDGVLRLVPIREANEEVEFWGADEESRDEITIRLTLATRVEGAGPEGLAVAVSRLCPAEVEVLESQPAEGLPADDLHDLHDDPDYPDDLNEREQPEEPASADAGEASVPAAPAAPVTLRPSPTPGPLRSPVGGVRTEITHGVTLGANALHEDRFAQDTAIRLPELEELRRGVPELADLTGPGDHGSEPSEPSEPSGPSGPSEPDGPAGGEERIVVIGNQLSRARQRLGLSVDQVAERTRIRPHVIEAIEIDDFEACGGDFYARGHVRTLSRVLGVDATPLLEDHAARYSQAPIDARRVFEAELAAGSTGSIRATRGGPNWSVLIAAVMAVILVWSVARLVLDNPASVEPDAPALNPSGGLRSGPAAAPEVPVVLTAAGGGARVIVRNGSEVVFNGPIAFGQTTTLEVSPPIRISTTDGSLAVSVDGDDRGPMGETGQEAQETFVVP